MYAHFDVFGFPVPYYGFFYGVGLFSSALLSLLVIMRKHIDKYDLVCSSVFFGITGVIGAKILHSIQSLPLFFAGKISFWNLLLSGMAFYGVLIGGIFGVWVFSKIFKTSFLTHADIYATMLPLGLGIGRIGCYMASCCYGIPYDGPLAVTYTESPADLTPIGIPLFPVQLLESAFLILLFIAQVIIYRKSAVGSGAALLSFCIFYPAARFFLEFVRYDNVVGVFLGLSPSQWISLLILGATLGVILYRRQKARTIA